MNFLAEQVLRAVEDAGGRLVLVPGGIVVEPADLLDATLRRHVRTCGQDLVNLLRRRLPPCAARDGRQIHGKPSPSHPLPAGATIQRAACELRRFAEWRPAQVVRFCCEPDHRHEDGVPTYDFQEVALVLDWCMKENVPQLPMPLRNALLGVKAAFAGRIVIGTST